MDVEGCGAMIAKKDMGDAKPLDGTSSIRWSQPETSAGNDSQINGNEGNIDSLQVWC